MNSGIFFKLETDEKEIIDKFYNRTSSDLKRSAFYRNLFLLGFNQKKKEFVEENSEEAKRKVFE